MIGQLFSIFFAIIVPVFALVVVGYLAGPRLALDARSFSRLSYTVLTPAFIFSTLYRTKIEIGLVLRMIFFITAVTLGCAVVGFIVARLLRRPAKMIGAYILIAVFGNVGNFGFPIIEFTLGSDALGSTVIYFLVILVISFIIGVAAANFERGGSAGAALAVLRTPGLLVVPPAVLFNWLQIEMPMAALRSIDLLAGALIPIMLIGLGIQLANVGIPRPTADTWIASSIRLLVGPLLAFALGPFFGVVGMEHSVGILQSAMPAAVLASIIATENDMLPTFVISTVLFSTLLSIVTLTIVIALFVPLF